MGTKLSLILIEGDQTSRLDSFFKHFGFKDADDDEEVKSFSDAIDALDANRSTGYLAVSLCKGWTLIIDPYREMIFEGRHFQDIASSLNTRIFAWAYYCMTGWAQFGYYDGKNVRELVFDNPIIIQDDGIRLEFEPAYDRNAIGESELTYLMEKITCITMEDLEKHTGFTIKKFT